MQAWASYDDGQTWQPVQVIAMGNGKQRVVLNGRPTASTSGAVSLRVKAADAAGNSIDQTIIRAFGL